MRLTLISRPLILFAALAILPCSGARAASPLPLPTGKFITPLGTQTGVGSFPVNAALSPDGKFLVVTGCGAREYLSVLSARDGRLVSQLKIAGKREDNPRKQKGLYYGLAFGPARDGVATLYVSRGEEQAVAVYTLDARGQLAEDPGRRIHCPNGDRDFPRVLAGLALDSGARRLYAADNTASSNTRLMGALLILDTRSGNLQRSVELPGYPFAVAALTRGPQADRKVYVSSERDGLVSVIDPAAGKVLKNIPTGSHPIALLLDRAQRRLFVANAASDTISVIDTAADKVIDTILVRPEDARGLPGATPAGLALSPDERRLYVTLADMNAVAVVALDPGRPAALAGYLPVGYYPTAVAATPDGKRLLVSNANGVNVRNPNGKPAGPGGAWGQYVLDIIEGTVSTFPVPAQRALEKHTRRVIENNLIRPGMEKAESTLKNPGIKHIIYIIKENRTYDQVFGDLPQGNGDPSLCLFPREVTPNQHALAERFVLLDNFYVCADVSSQGWNWSTSGMLSEFTARNTPYMYTQRGRRNDNAGRNSEIIPDLAGVPDVATAPCGYIWDLFLRHGIELRNYGFFVSRVEEDERRPGRRLLSPENVPTKKALVGRTDENFRVFDMTYADSEAWVRHACPPAPAQKKTYGSFDAPSRFTEWKREFDQYVKDGNLPPFLMVRLPRNHTQGTSPGFSSPRAMVADNDYAVGQLVEAVSNSPYWRSTAICILEDDAQNGHDHVDAHRSPALVISPFVRKGTVDHRFYNTDGMLRTMELLMGLPPMNQFDATAAPLDVFGEHPDNDAPWQAILPAREIIAEVNGKDAYKAKQSATLDFTREDSVPDEVLTEILWHAVKGAATPQPAIRHGMRMFAAVEDDDD